MQGLRGCSNDGFCLDLMSPASTRPAATTSGCGESTTTNTTSLSIDEAESTESKIQRLISEHPVIIFTRSSCCMCHVMKRLLASVGVHPTVIELDDHEIGCLPTAAAQVGPAVPNPVPALFIGGACVGGLESLVALHLSGHLVPRLIEVGALWV